MIISIIESIPDGEYGNQIIKSAFLYSSERNSIFSIWKHKYKSQKAVPPINASFPCIQQNLSSIFTGDPLHNRAACTQPCNVNTHSRAHCSPGARLCEQWGHGCVNNGARPCASARLCRGSPVILPCFTINWWNNDRNHSRKYSEWSRSIYMRRKYSHMFYLNA